MSETYVIDAHALIWYLEANPRLGTKAKEAMQDPASRLYLPVIALAEAFGLWSTTDRRYPRLSVS